MNDLQELLNSRIGLVKVVNDGFIFHIQDGEKICYKINTFNSSSDALVKNPYEGSNYIFMHDIYKKPDGSGVRSISYEYIDWYKEWPKDNNWRELDVVRIRERSGNIFYLLIYSIFPSYKSKDFIEDVDHRLTHVDDLPDDISRLIDFKNSGIDDIDDIIESLDYYY